MLTDCDELDDGDRSLLLPPPPFRNEDAGDKSDAWSELRPANEASE